MAIAYTALATFARENNSSDDGDLFIALESEAIAASFKQHTEAMGINPEGKVVLVVDGGEGTVDLTVHKIVGNQIQEIVQGNGHKHGGNAITNKFVKNAW